MYNIAILLIRGAFYPVFFILKKKYVNSEDAVLEKQKGSSFEYHGKAVYYKKFLKGEKRK